MATIAEVREWLSPGFALHIEGPFAEVPEYRVTIPEFGVSGEGGTTEDATRNALDALGKRFARYLSENAVLPDRREWIKKLQAERSELAPA